MLVFLWKHDSGFTNSLEGIIYFILPLLSIISLHQSWYRSKDNVKLTLLSKQQEQELAISEQRYRSLFQYHTDAVFSLGLDGNIIDANTKFLSMTELNETKLRDFKFSTVIPPMSMAKVLRNFIAAKKGKSQYYEIAIKDWNGNHKYLSVTYIPIFAEDKVNGVFGIAKDLTQLKETEKKINHLAYHDPLTGLPNRRYFESLLDQAIAEAEVNNKMLAVLFLDLDHFKIINDTLGHSTGDDLLVAVGQRLSQSLANDHITARHGGDEFILLLKSIDHIEQVINNAEKVLGNLQQPFLINNHRVSVTPSIGISIYPEDANNSQTLMKHADKAMYRVKYQGKNHYSIYKPLSDGKALRKVAISKDIHTVLEDNQLEVHYQPQICTTTGLIYGVEALVRWNHPGLGLISPAEFIPLAEATGVIFALNDWVLDKACADLKKWHEQGYFIYMAVNVSPQQFYSEESLSEKVNKTLDKYQVSSNYLVIEITEAIAINNMDIAINKLIELQGLGVQIALDDFGTGYSSLSYLTQLPIDTIKIAREVIDDIGSRSASKAILSAVVTMANDLNLKIVLEGVEKEEQLRQLMHFRSHYMQGYYFSRPIPKSEMDLLLDEWSGSRLLKVLAL